MKNPVDIKKLLETSRLILEELDYEALIEKIVMHAVEYFNADAGAIGILDSERNVVYPYLFNLPSKIKKVKLPSTGGVAGLIIKTNKPIKLDDYPSHPMAVKEYVKAGVKTLLAVPLKTSGDPFGALGIFGKSYKKVFTNEQMNELVIFGALASTAIVNSRQYSELKSLKENLSKMVEIKTRELQNIVDEHALISRAIVHDIKRPIEHIIEIMSSTEGTPKLEEIKSTIKLINDIIDGLHRYFSIESVAISKKKCDLNEVVHNIVKLNEKTIRQEGATIKVLPLPAVKTDETLLYLTLSNVLSNSIKAIKGSRLRRIKIGWDNDKKCIFVEDSGVGIPPHIQDIVLKPFSKYNKNGFESGLGLGLTIAQKAMKLLNGEIKVTSTPGKGTKVCLHLPDDEN